MGKGGERGKLGEQRLGCWGIDAPGCGPRTIASVQVLVDPDPEFLNDSYVLLRLLQTAKNKTEQNNPWWTYAIYRVLSSCNTLNQYSDIEARCFWITVYTVMQLIQHIKPLRRLSQFTIHSFGQLSRSLLQSFFARTPCKRTLLQAQSYRCSLYSKSLRGEQKRSSLGDQFVYTFLVSVPRQK